MPRGRRASCRLYETIVRHKPGWRFLPLPVFYSALSFSSSVEMAPKTRSGDSSHVSPLDPHDLGSQHSSVVPTYDTFALDLEQMALINARRDAQSAVAAAAVAAAHAADSPVA
jgi:hypothetical protein